MNNFDDFDTSIQPEEFIFNEDILDDNPIDEDFEPRKNFASDLDWELEEAQFSTEYDEDNW